MSKVLELKANDAWAEFGVAAREFVALGFEDAMGIVWYELPNRAGVGEFLVDGEDVHDVLVQAQKDLGAAFSDAGRVLWHSHYIAIEPSAADLENFPKDLVDVAFVYHAPTGVTTLYKAVEHLPSTLHAEAALGTAE